MSKRTCLLVLGMHRSGTSAVTRVLNLAGAELPATLLGGNEGNVTGHWESIPLIQVHDKLLESLDSAWDDWRKLPTDQMTTKQRNQAKRSIQDVITNEFGDAGLIVVKDPRICRFAPLFIDALTDIEFDVKIVQVLRNPLEVCKSLEHRDGLSRIDAALLWLRHVLDAQSATRDFDRVIVSYEQLLNNWKAVFGDISQALGLKMLHSAKDFAPEAEAFLSSEYRHHSHSTKEVWFDPDLGKWVGDTYEALIILARNQESHKALITLAKVAQAFNQSAPVLHRLFIAARSESNEHNKSIEASQDRLVSERDQLIQVVRDANLRLELEANAVRELRKIVKINVDQLKTVVERNQLNRLEIEELKSIQNALFRSTSWRMTAPVRWLGALFRRSADRGTATGDTPVAGDLQNGENPDRPKIKES